MATPIIDWPLGVPSCIMPLSPQGGLQDNRISFEPDAGVPIERPRTTWAPEVYAVDLVPLTVAQFTTFQRWYRADLASGTLPFRFLHPITRIVSPWRIVKGNPPYQVSKSRRAATPETRCVSLSFSIMSWPASFVPGFLAQEGSGLVLQEQADRIIISDGYDFDPGA